MHAKLLCSGWVGEIWLVGWLVGWVGWLCCWVGWWGLVGWLVGWLVVWKPLDGNFVSQISSTQLNSPKLSTLLQKTTFYRASHQWSFFRVWYYLIQIYLTLWKRDDHPKHTNSIKCVVLIQFPLESSPNRSSTNSIWGSSYLWFTQEKPCKPIRWYSPAFDWVQISPITAHIERPKGIAGNVSTVKNTK